MKKNNLGILILSMALGLAIGIYFPNSKVVYILMSILRGIR
jgi:hypothetical protein